MKACSPRLGGRAISPLQAASDATMRKRMVGACSAVDGRAAQPPCRLMGPLDGIDGIAMKCGIQQMWWDPRVPCALRRPQSQDASSARIERRAAALLLALPCGSSSAAYVSRLPQWYTLSIGLIVLIVDSLEAVFDSLLASTVHG